MNHITVTMLGAESLGVRSMCTKVSTPDITVLLDPGCALGPRPGFETPHPVEYACLHETTARIIKEASTCDRIFISHYHHDHFKPRLHDETFIHSSEAIFKQVYTGKAMLVKSPARHVGKHQAARGRALKQSLARIATTIDDVDFKRLQFGDTVIDTSPPLPHGEPGSRLGHVLALRIRCMGDCFVYAPDVQGPVTREAMEFLLAVDPDMAYVGGPPWYLEASLTRFPYDLASRSLQALHERVPVLVVDHHALRDGSRGEERIARIRDGSLARDHVVLTAASHAGLEPRYLEASRAALYTEMPPDGTFTSWAGLDRQARNATPPPVGTGLLPRGG